MHIFIICHLVMNYKKYLNKKIPINPYSGYPNTISQKREIMALQLLNSYCNKYPSPYGSHFPKLLDYKKNIYINLSNQGLDLKTLKKTKYKILLPNFNEQIKIIYNILIKCGIYHLDLNNNGKNICISRNGIISLIDFDIIHFVHIDNIKTLTPQMIKRIYVFDYCQSYEKFYEKMFKIINSCKNIILTNKSILHK